MLGFLLLIILLLILISLFLQRVGALSSLLFRELLCLSIAKRANSISRTGQFVDAVCDLTSTNQRDDNAGTDDECQDEAVDSVP